MQTLPPLACRQALKLGFQNFAKFSGRSRRSEFFYFQISLILIEYSIFYALVYFFGEEEGNEFRLNEDAQKLVWILFLLSIICLIPQTSITVRRLHDINRTGFYVLVIFIPFFGYILLFVFCCIDSDQGTNEYGPSPKYVMVPSENNYNPPIPDFPVNPYPYPNDIAVPINPYKKANPILPDPIPFSQPYLLPPEIMNNPQQNDINSKNVPYSYENPIPPPPEGVPYPSLDDSYSEPNNIQSPVSPYFQPNPIQCSGETYSKPNLVQSSGETYSQQNSIQPSVDIYSQKNHLLPSDNVYSKPNPIQSSSENYYNSCFNGQ